MKEASEGVGLMEVSQQRIKEDSALYSEAVMLGLTPCLDLKRIVSLWLQIVDNPNPSRFVSIAEENLRSIDPKGKLQKEIREARALADGELTKEKKQIGRKVKVTL
jgi:hypothetical protein